MRQYFYTNGEGVIIINIVIVCIARWVVFECGDGLYSRDSLQSHEILFENETNGTKPCS
jgi:hypothetical protein